MNKMPYIYKKALPNKVQKIKNHRNTSYLKIRIWINFFFVFAFFLVPYTFLLAPNTFFLAPPRTFLLMLNTFFARAKHIFARSKHFFFLHWANFFLSHILNFLVILDKKISEFFCVRGKRSISCFLGEKTKLFKNNPNTFFYTEHIIFCKIFPIFLCLGQEKMCAVQEKMCLGAKLLCLISLNKK